VPVERLQPGVVLNDDIVAVPDQVAVSVGHRPSQDDGPIRRSENGRAQWNRQVNARVEVRKAGIGGLERVGGRTEALRDGRMRDGHQEPAGRVQHRVGRDQLGVLLEVLLGPDRLLDLAEHAIGLHPN